MDPSFAVNRTAGTAVVLLNLGGPSSYEEIRSFLFSLFYDPDILSLPNPFRFILAQFISRIRMRTAQEMYAVLGGSSPLLANTKAQAQALEKELGDAFRVFVAMRHAAPFAEETIEEVAAYSPEKIVLLPLYPQFSITTTGSSLKAWAKAARAHSLPSFFFIESYPSEFGFIEALKEHTLSSYQEAKAFGYPRLLMTAHGLPQTIIQQGDPYQRHVEETAKSFVQSLKIPKLDSVLCYQSRIGPRKWLTPYVEDEIIKAAREKRPLVVVPLSFVSEHIETLVELDITYRKRALEAGCPSYQRVQTVQTHSSFIKGLARLVKQSILTPQGEERC